MQEPEVPQQSQPEKDEKKPAEGEKTSKLPIPPDAATPGVDVTEPSDRQGSGWK